MAIKENVFVYDVTLRDGEQAYGFQLKPREKVKVAQGLCELGVDGIEAGFAASSPGDAWAIVHIAKTVGRQGKVVISSLARATREDVEAAARAVSAAYRPRVHTFVATSDLHLKYKLLKSRQWALDKTADMVRHAKRFVEDVEFSLEDFTRTETAFAVQVAIAAVQAGARTINLPDTVGLAHPVEYAGKVKAVKDALAKRGYYPTISVHTHNDLGLATANTLSAVMYGGARQVEVTVNGIGERAGNCSLEELVAIFNTKDVGFGCNVKTGLIVPTSTLVSGYTGVWPQPNKAVVGPNAFNHAAGIHQDGIYKNRETYEILVPEDYGTTSTISFSSRSGSSALEARLGQLGFSLNGELVDVYARFKAIADEKKVIDDADIVEAVVGKGPKDRYRVVSIEGVVTDGAASGSVVVAVDGRQRKASISAPTVQGAVIDAAVQAIGTKGYAYDIHGGKFGGYECTMQAGPFTVKGHSESRDGVLGPLHSFVAAHNRLAFVQERRPN